VTPLAPVAVLVVDDNPIKRLGLRAILSPLDCTVVEADSGVAALRASMAEDFAVILLDVRMPGMDGFETAAFLRQRRQSEMTPIIFVTAFHDDELLETERYAGGAVDFMSAPVPPDALRAKVAVFVSLFRKAQELALAAREVQTAADQLRLLTDAAPIGIFQTDAEGRFVYTNPRWSEITGIPSGEAAGQAWEAILRSTDRAGQISALPDDAAVRIEGASRFEKRIPGTETRIMLVTSEAITAPDGGNTGWVGTLADVTAEVGAEAAMSAARDEATEASRLKSDFLANMSHEIRTPMNGVLSMTDLLLETTLDHRQRDYAQTVRNSGEALLTIIDDILDFSKVEAGKVLVEEVDFDLRTVVDDVASLLATSAQTKGLELASLIATDLPMRVRGDPGRVRQVLMNLLGNAIKFTAQGEVVVRVAAVEGTGSEAVVRFEVSDTGDGIAADKLATVFSPFVQADTSTTRKYGGTGLGLAISSQLVGLMGGDCGVSSRLGAGSAFWFTVRVRTPAGEVIPGPFPDDGACAGVAVLVVDGSATQRGILSEYLTGWGMSVVTSASGDAVHETLRTAAADGRPFAIAFLDRSTVGGDGRELADAIAADEAVTARPVLMAGIGQAGDLMSRAGSGGGASLTKPVSLRELAACVRSALGIPDPEATPPGLGGPEGPGTSPTSGRRRLLVAEDNLINQKVAVALLSGAGYHVDTVLNGAAAVEAVAATPYDAILMDCQMPELNGYEATAAIRAHEGAHRHTPIIAMTAGARTEDRERCLAEGMDGYVSKPVNKGRAARPYCRICECVVPGRLRSECKRADGIGSGRGDSPSLPRARSSSETVGKGVGMFASQRLRLT
jgi:PAS domain S-box-containing protein